MTIIQTQNTDGSASIIDNGATSYREIQRLDGERGAYTDPANFVSLEDDFLGDVIADQWSAAKGTDGQGVIATVVAGAANGVVRLTSGDTTTVAESLSSLTHGLNWKAGNGGLYMKTRVKAVSSVADVSICVGFTDVLATTTLEEPFSISGTTITSNATDAVCFVFDTAQTNDALHMQGVKNGTDTAISNSGVALSADEYVTLEIDVDSSGSATFYIDGVAYATVANAVTTTVALTPVVSIMARTTTSKSIDVDYIRVGQLRA